MENRGEGGEDQDNAAPDLIEEEDMSVSKGAIKNNIYKSFVNINSQICRRSERLANKKGKSSSYFYLCTQT